MFESPVTKKTVFLALFFSFFVCLFIFINNYFDERTKIVFCDVGQGDGAYIRIKNKVDVLIDAGPDQKILSCLGKYMPFWDRKIELAFLSHPNRDHYNGYFFIADRYKIDRFITVDVNDLIVSKTYKKLINKISDKNIPVLFKYSGDKILLGKGDSRIAPTITLYWPPKDFTSPNDNDFSSVILFSVGVLPASPAGGREKPFRLLFTGDASSFVLGRLSHGAIKKVDILKIPHHGSKNGLTKRFLDLADPMIAVISVGKGNSYGHPHQKILDMLKAKNIYTEQSRSIKILRTDKDGDIKFEIN